MIPHLAEQFMWMLNVRITSILLFLPEAYTIFGSVETQAPKIEETNLRGDKPMKKALGEPLRLQCKFTGTPVPQISWYKVRLSAEIILEVPIIG